MMPAPVSSLKTLKLTLFRGAPYNLLHNGHSLAHEYYAESGRNAASRLEDDK